MEDRLVAAEMVMDKESGDVEDRVVAAEMVELVIVLSIVTILVDYLPHTS